VSAYKTYTKEQRTKALRLHKKGWGYARIASDIGCFPSTVKKWVDSAGVAKHPGPAYSSAKKKAAVDYYKNNTVSIKKAADHAGVHTRTMTRWLEESKVKTRTIEGRVGRKGIIKDLKSGMSKRAIAKKHKCSESWVYRVQRGD